MWVKMKSMTLIFEKQTDKAIYYNVLKFKFQ